MDISCFLLSLASAVLLFHNLKRKVRSTSSHRDLASLIERGNLRCFFNMLMAAEIANTDLPLLVVCVKFA